MNVITALILFCSTLLGATKNVLIKGISGYSIKTREFFIAQSGIFGAGSVALLIINLFTFKGISLTTVICSILYGIILISGLWCYTLALSQGKTAVCATVYSFGFIVPTLSGTLFWNEKISIFGYLGILILIPVLIISGTSPKKQDNKQTNKTYIIPLIIALLSSGGLGVMQKIHQSSKSANEMNTFLLLSFVFAFTVSIIFAFATKKGENKIERKSISFSLIVGVIFSLCNIMNTYLAGVLDSAVLFPILNIGTILVSLLLSVIIYKEKIDRRDVLILILGILAIILVNF